MQVNESNFFDKYELIRTDDKTDYIFKVRKIIADVEIKKENEGLLGEVEEDKYELLLQLYDRLIYGLSTDDIKYEDSEFIDNDIKIETVNEEKEEIIETKDEEVQQWIHITQDDVWVIEDVINSYQSNKDCTCLFSVFLNILKDPSIFKYIPFDHLVKLGLNKLYDKMGDEIYENNTLLDIAIEEKFGSLNLDYLTYAKYYNMNDEYIDNLSELYKEDLDYLKNIFISKTYKIQEN